MKTVSVIIPCYNSSRYITQAIHSVLLQEEFILEIICIDDCSQDDTVEIIEKIRTKNGIVKLIKNDVNSGPATSRNIGLDAARGDYIAFLDSDDYWISGKIETQLLYILREGYDCVFSKFIIESDNAINKDISIKSISLNKLIFKNYISTSSVLMKKNNYRFLNELRYSEDYDFWLRLAISGYKLGFITSPLYIRKEAKDNTSLSNNFFSMQHGEIKALVRNCSEYKALLLPALIFSMLRFIRRYLLSIYRRL